MTPKEARLHHTLQLAESKQLESFVKTRTKEVDEERVDYMKRIRLETSFYAVFRNTIRVLLHDYENSKIREKIESEVLKDYILYDKKWTTIQALLKELVRDKVQFIGDEKYYKLLEQNL
jgi:hypothetical protein